MNWLDIALLLIVGASIASGAAKGFARLVIGLLAALAAVVCGLWLYGTAGGWLRPYVSHPGLANFLGFVLVFAIVLAAGAALGKLVSVALKWSGLSWVDRLLGASFGLLRGAVVGLALVLALMAFAPHKPPQAVTRSRVAPYLVGAAKLISGIAPYEVREGVTESYEKARQIWGQIVEGPQKARRKPARPMIR